MDTKVPQLTDTERLTLQNLMLRYTVEQQNIEKCGLLIAVAKERSTKIQDSLNNWRKEFSKRLELVGLDIKNLEIDAETGTVRLLDKEVPDAMS